MVNFFNTDGLSHAENVSKITRRHIGVFKKISL